MFVLRIAKTENTEIDPFPRDITTFELLLSLEDL